MGSESYASTSSYFQSEGTAISIAKQSDCNTSLNDPCFQLSIELQYMAVGSYKITNNYAVGNPFMIVQFIMATNPSNQYLAETTSYGASNFPTLTINIIHVGNIGENVTGNFSGTIIRELGVASPKLVNVSGSFNVYREN